MNNNVTVRESEGPVVFSATDGSITYSRYGISVKSFGATGDGVTDDFPAIAAAIDSLPGSGGTIIFPPGDYKISESLTSRGRSQLSLIGEGGQFSAKIVASGNFPVVWGVWRYCRFENLSIDAAGHGGMGFDVFFDQTSIRDVFIMNWSQYGMRLNDWAPDPDTLGWLNAIEKVHIASSNGVGIRTGYRFTDSWIDGCNIGSTLENINVEGGPMRIVNCHLDGNPTHNIVFRGNRRIHVSQNILEGSTEEAIVWTQPFWDTYDIHTQIQIVNNLFMNGSVGNEGQYSAIQLNGLANDQRGLGFIISDNVMGAEDAGAGFKYCVEATNIRDFTITGNVWYDAFREDVPMSLVNCYAPFNVSGNGGVDGAIGIAAAPTSRRVPPIRGINLSPWATGTAAWDEAVEELNPTHVTVPVRIECPSTTSSTVTVNASDLARAVSYDPGDAKLIVEPYPWIDSGAASETEWNPTDKGAWETNYRAALMQIADAFPDAWGFYIGSNLVYLEPETPRWVNIVSGVRSELPNAKVIYRTNWWITAEWDSGTQTAFQSKINSPLFDLPDIIAVAAYFELMDAADPSEDEIKENLYSTTLYSRFQNVYDECRQLAEACEKPLLFGELICARYDGALASPWRPWNPPDTPPPHNWMVQVRYFRAVYDVFRDSDWWEGYSVYGVAYPYGDGGYNLTPGAKRWVSKVNADGIE